MWQSKVRTVIGNPCTRGALFRPTAFFHFCPRPFVKRPTARCGGWAHILLCGVHGQCCLPGLFNGSSFSLPLPRCLRQAYPSFVGTPDRSSFSQSSEEPTIVPSRSPPTRRYRGHSERLKKRWMRMAVLLMLRSVNHTCEQHACGQA